MARLYHHHHYRHHQLPTFILFGGLALLLLFTYESGVSAERCTPGGGCTRITHCCCLEGTDTNVLLDGAVLECKPKDDCKGRCVCDTNHDCPGKCCCGVGPNKVALCVSPTVCKDRLRGACRCLNKTDCPNPACCCRKDLEPKSYGKCQVVKNNKARTCPTDKPKKVCSTRLFEFVDP